MACTIPEIFIHERAALAPLAGVTGSEFRQMCVGFGARPVMTEMVSSDGFVRGRPSGKTARFLRFEESERPIGFQFFGADPDIMAEAASKAQDLKPDFIDINAGCPVKKVIAKGSGSALLRNPFLLARIVEKMVNVSNVPVTVKIRSGWDQSSINAVEVARVCMDSGARAIIVHPRTKSQGFSGSADWTVIKRVQEKVDIPVVGSGDIKTAEDFQRMKDETGVEYVMVGRTAMNNPFIFREIVESADENARSKQADYVEKLELALNQLDRLAVKTPEKNAVFTMRKFFGWYSKGAIGGAQFRSKIFRAVTVEEVKKIVRDFQYEYRDTTTRTNVFNNMVIS